MAKWSLSLSVVLAAATSAYAGPVEWRPTLSGGWARVVDAHGSFGGSLRIQLARYCFVQPEILVLPTGGHTDQGVTLMVGLSGPSRDGLRPYIGLGGGPFEGYAGDDGMGYAAAGVSWVVLRRHRVFLQVEGRMGFLGESSYSQMTLGVGLSR